MRTSFLLACFLVFAGCAKGSVEDDGDRVRTDGGSRDGGTRDASPIDLGGRDFGTVEMCDDDEYPDTCAEADDLGEIGAGAGSRTIEGVLPRIADEDWFAVHFPPAMSGAGGGTISIELAADATAVMTIEGPTCGPRATCGGEGETAGAILSYSYTDDADESADMPYQSRMVPWPETLFVRVHRIGGPATCMPYTLTISR
ncbi:MAG: hypothetical protein CMN30_21790 [Sandaracinus sp.]|nr:hypothetical protein [Sandaracinus sp.]